MDILNEIEKLREEYKKWIESLDLTDAIPSTKAIIESQLYMAKEAIEDAFFHSQSPDELNQAIEKIKEAKDDLETVKFAVFERQDIGIKALSNIKTPEIIESVKDFMDTDNEIANIAQEHAEEYLDVNKTVDKGFDYNKQYDSSQDKVKSLDDIRQNLSESKNLMKDGFKMYIRESSNYLKLALTDKIQNMPAIKLAAAATKSTAEHVKKTWEFTKTQYQNIKTVVKGIPQNTAELAKTGVNMLKANYYAAATNLYSSLANSYDQRHESKRKLLEMTKEQLDTDKVDLLDNLAEAKSKKQEIENTGLTFKEEPESLRQREALLKQVNVFSPYYLKDQKGAVAQELQEIRDYNKKLQDTKQKGIDYWDDKINYLESQLTYNANAYKDVTEQLTMIENKTKSLNDKTTQYQQKYEQTLDDVGFDRD